MHAILFSLLAFIFAMMILITVHEFGHFWVARLCGVKVLRFSIGFGKPLFCWKSRSGTEYVLAIFPLGGYVKMVDEREGPVCEDDLPYAFNRQSVKKRIAIVSAGPFFNLLFAFLTYWLMFVVGVYSIAPMIGQVEPKSIAGAAGLKANEEIIEINGKPTVNWEDVYLALMRYVGSPHKVTFTVKNSTLTQKRQLDLSHWHLAEKDPMPLKSLGITPFQPKIPALISSVIPNEAAANAGIKPNDRIIAVNGENVDDWMKFVDVVKNHPNKTLPLIVLRNHSRVSLSLTPSLKRSETGESVGYIGAKVNPVNFPKHLLRIQHYNLFYALTPALKETGSMIGLTFIMLWKLVSGYVSLHSLSGPVGIAMGAGISASLGAASYLNFLALVSISLAVLNFLPIPVLDGGYLLYYFVEIIRGKPLSETVEMVALKVGIFLLMSLMIIAFYNDLARLLG